MSRMFSSRIILIPLFQRLRLVTDGTATDAAPIYIDLDVPAFAHILPHCESVTLHTFTEGRTANHQWNVVFRSGFIRGAEGTAIKLAPAGNIVTNGSAVHAGYTTVTNFGLESRLQIQVNNGAGTAFENALASAALACKTWGT